VKRGWFCRWLETPRVVLRRTTLYYVSVMRRETISFRLESEKREALDAVASALDRDRSYIINEAIEAYLDVQRWQMQHIREGLRQADAGEFATEAEMKTTFSRRHK
jgi:RHH-type transcriptional regulator, rel operon repressor / antitoxin RelB